MNQPGNNPSPIKKPRPIGTGVLVRLKPGHSWNSKDDVTLGGNEGKVVGHQIVYNAGTDNEYWSVLQKDSTVKSIDLGEGEARVGVPKVASMIRKNKTAIGKALEANIDYNKAEHMLGNIVHEVERWFKKGYGTHVQIGDERTIFSVIEGMRGHTSPTLCIEEENMTIRIMHSGPFDYPNKTHGWSYYIDITGKRNSDMNGKNFKIIPDGNGGVTAKYCSPGSNNYTDISDEDSNLLEKISGVLLSAQVQNHAFPITPISWKQESMTAGKVLVKKAQ